MLDSARPETPVPRGGALAPRPGYRGQRSRTAMAVAERGSATGEPAIGGTVAPFLLAVGLPAHGSRRRDRLAGLTRASGRRPAQTQGHRSRRSGPVSARVVRLPPTQLVDGQQELLVLVALLPSCTVTGEAGDEHQRVAADRTRIFARQSSPGHRLDVSRHTGIPAASSIF